MSIAAPKPRTRWFHLTPDRCLLGLLTVQGALLLSEQLGWFAKGWAVLTAIAAVGVWVLFMLLWYAASLLLRWRFQFSIRSLLVLTLAVAMPFSWLAVRMKEAKRQHVAIAALEALGKVQDWVVYDRFNPPDPFSSATKTTRHSLAEATAGGRLLQKC